MSARAPWRADLHAHSACSDGTGSPARVMAEASAAGLAAVALTDHDTAAGWEEALRACRELGLGFIPGMELSCRREVAGRVVSVHLLAYLVDPAHDGLVRALAQVRASRASRAERMVRSMERDLDISWEALLRRVGPHATVGRPHIADELVLAGVARDRGEAFGRWLHPDSPYYAHYASLDPALAVELVLEAGGVPVLAHPGARTRGAPVGMELMEELVEAGLAGVEARHREHSPCQRDALARWAEDRGLFASGSSDYHGTGKPNRLGENWTTRAVVERIVGLGSGSRAFLPR